MKLKLPFIIAAFIVLAVYTPAVHGQANLTFSGGNGTPLTTTLQNTLTYTIINNACADPSALGPFFVFDGAGPNVIGGNRAVTGNITFSINGGNAAAITNIGSGFVNSSLSGDEIYIYGNRPGVSSGTVVLSPGTITTTTNVASQAPASRSYTTFIINDQGVRCSNVLLVPTAASVSISGRVATASGRGIRNVVITMIDSNGNERTATSTAFGYYRFDDVSAGETVTLSAKAKRFKFNQSSIVRTTNESITDADFVSEQ